MIFQYNDCSITLSAFDYSSHTFTGTIYDSENNLIRKAQRATAGWTQIDPLNISDFRADANLEKGIYLGHFFASLNHFLVETLPNFFWLKLIDPVGLAIFHSWDNMPRNILELAHINIPINLLGIDTKNIIFLEKNTHVSNITIPPRAFVVNKGCTGDFSCVYETIKQKASLLGRNISAQRVYFSRRAEHNNGPIKNEESVEKIFKKNGFEIIFSGQVSFLDQILIASQAKILAGHEDSVLGWSLFMGNGGKIISYGMGTNPFVKISKDITGMSTFYLTNLLSMSNDVLLVNISELEKQLHLHL